MLIVNLASSASPVSEYVTLSASVSVALTVVTNLAFSATLIKAVSPPPLLVMVGAANKLSNLSIANAFVSNSPIFFSNTQSPPRLLEPVRSSDAAISAFVI